MGSELGIRILTQGFWGDTNIQYITGGKVSTFIQSGKMMTPVDLCGDDINLYLDCGGGYRNLPITIAMSLKNSISVYTHCTNIDFSGHDIILIIM